MHLLILSDGKKGHENQTLGLAEAILRRRTGTYEISSISQSKSGPVADRRPDAILAAGHSTHPFLLRLARRYRCPSIVVMKPSLPSFLFSQCLIPEHDLKPGKKLKPNIIATKGALNRIPEALPPKTEAGLIMLGGPSKHFDWQTQPLLAAIERIVSQEPQRPWTVGDSRRTPADLLPLLAEKLPNLEAVSHQDSPPDWLRDQMLEAEVAWITPDSTSMLFEALTAGCCLGTLPLTPNETRLSRAHDLLASQGWLTPFKSYSPPLPQAPAPLHESARCADLLLERLA
ncbi:mitochondrial fission ELM1 family protein [Roseibacillus persicicus]|uniref:Nucleoside-diphosphate sugar epimerase n=1 Tax=Roseibacillus persicicus TaxID=454148 RepID=A0A918TCD7_9BACT|nr:ELM1/GtrOC1 family putative glycosyltransferase [Roseibacillus persicicus]GHC40387.1 nucleoside-diphosphate sugar epimerase [Roseibacillus persicicus]